MNPPSRGVTVIVRYFRWIVPPLSDTICGTVVAGTGGLFEESCRGGCSQDRRDVGCGAAAVLPRSRAPQELRRRRKRYGVFHGRYRARRMASPDDRAHARRYCGLFDRGACGFGVSAGANDERYQLFRRRRSICYGDRSPGGSGWKRIRDLIFPTAKLGLFGSLWSPPDDGVEIDILSSDHAWAHAAFDAPISRDQTGERVIPLAFLVLMKLDAARGIDQSDINRILGRLSPEAVEEVVSLVGRFYDDSAAADDIRQSAAIGRWEYETPS